MNYKLFLLEQDTLDSECFCENYYLPEELDDTIHSYPAQAQGVSLKHLKKSDLKFTYKNKIIGDQLFVIGNYNLINQRFADLLSKFIADSIELIPVTLTCRGRRNKDYLLLNLLNLKSPIDYEKSEIKTLSTGKIIQVTKLGIKTNVSDEYDLFRFKEFKGKILISEKLKEEIEKEKISGISFRPLEGYQYPFKH